jgi:tagatose-6-phosphate ketose/aldose isomerase
MILGIADSTLKARGATWTAQEIAQQPSAWRKTQALLDAHAQELQGFLEPLLTRPDLRVILTGAGSSAHIGRCLLPELLRRTSRRIEAIATTDLVAGPHEYLQKHVPTLLVSFARSGNSPESLAAVDLADQYIAECYHLIITCNASGRLYDRCHSRPKACGLLLPEETHDRGFAMTSSFSAMTYAGLGAFCGAASLRPSTPTICAAAAAMIEEGNAALQALASREYERVVFLGSRQFAGLAAEASLKLLELTDGRTMTIAETPLGFRHGPKTIVNRFTLIVMFLSNDPMSRKYEFDLLRELHADAQAGRIVAVTAQVDAAAQLGEHLLVPGMSKAGDMELVFPYAVCAQIYALHRALALGNTPDQPSASGTVNRVVQGVSIYSQ